MSRTKKGAKGPGYEYWGKRRGSGLPPGRTSKKIYHQQERAEGKRDLAKQPREPEYDPREYIPYLCESNDCACPTWKDEEE